MITIIKHENFVTLMSPPPGGGFWTVLNPFKVSLWRQVGCEAKRNWCVNDISDIVIITTAVCKTQKIPKHPLTPANSLVRSLAADCNDRPATLAIIEVISPPTLTFWSVCHISTQTACQR